MMANVLGEDEWKGALEVFEIETFQGIISSDNKQEKIWTVRIKNQSTRLTEQSCP